MIKTEAWTIHPGPEVGNSGTPEPAKLSRETISLPDLTESEVLFEPIYGCWEGNMGHAVAREPVDVCRMRDEDRVVLGTAALVRVVRTGSAVTRVTEGDLCLFLPVGAMDEFGYMRRIFAYDQPRTTGMLARQTKAHERCLIRVPDNGNGTPLQWAASQRNLSAWSNWKVAYHCWLAQMSRYDVAVPHVWAWGGGVALAELELANRAGCKTAMMTSDKTRAAYLERRGIKPIDRRRFPNLQMDPKRYKTDPEFRAQYKESEKAFLECVQEETDGQGVAIFIDHIGAPVYRATVLSLARQGVIATAGWKHGMSLHLQRASECISRHLHVHTHAFRYHEAAECIEYQAATDWLPDFDEDVCPYEEVPQLAADYVQGKVTSYFPLFQVNSM